MIMLNIKEQSIYFSLYLIMEIFILTNCSYNQFLLSKIHKKDGLKFFKPCPELNYKYDNATGNFMCTVPTAKKCYELCQRYGCYEWPFKKPIPLLNELYRHNYRCRCFKEYNTCLYNSLSRKQIHY
ncbi:unnamed protein product [Schistosoma spindalis]|nr:unnamed protein product [Schistosoma spindale]